MAKRKADAESGGEEESGDFSFDPGTQIELEVETTCCITGEDVEASFCRFPDYINGTLLVMSRKEALKHLRADTSLDVFREVLVKRHGKSVLKGYASS